MRARASRTRMIAVIALLGLSAACATSATRADGAPESSTRLTQEQLGATNTSNLYDAIAKLKPEWVTSRGPVSATDPTPAVASVFMNGTMLGKVEYLRQIGILDVTEVRYWDPGQASARFGMGHPRGVIEVSRK